MKKRVLGAAAVVILLVGIWMGNFFKGLGLGGPGTGDAEREGEPGRTQVGLNSESAPEQSDEPAASDASLYSDEVLTVLVAGSGYSIESESAGAAAFTPASLDEIVAQAKDKPGDRNGIRVRLRFRRDAESGATSDLYEALQVAGIAREAILETTGYAD